MAKTENELFFEIVTPEKVVYKDKVKKVTLPTMVGQITVLPGHESLVGVIVPGEICTQNQDGGDVCIMVVEDGFIEIDENQVKVFADMAKKVEELDEKLILSAKKEAEEAIKNKAELSRLKFYEASTNLKKELIKLKALKKYKNRK